MPIFVPQSPTIRVASATLICHSGSPKANPEPMNADRASLRTIQAKPPNVLLVPTGVFMGSGLSPSASPGMTAVVGRARIVRSIAADR